MQTYELYEKAKAADKAFQTALVARYGTKAGDMRYSYDLPADLKALGQAKVNADHAWLDEMKRRDIARNGR